VTSREEKSISRADMEEKKKRWKLGRRQGEAWGRQVKEAERRPARPGGDVQRPRSTLGLLFGREGAVIGDPRVVGEDERCQARNETLIGVG